MSVPIDALTKYTKQINKTKTVEIKEKKLTKDFHVVIPQG